MLTGRWLLELWGSLLWAKVGGLPGGTGHGAPLCGGVTWVTPGGPSCLQQHSQEGGTGSGFSSAGLLVKGWTQTPGTSEVPPTHCLLSVFCETGTPPQGR